MFILERNDFVSTPMHVLGISFENCFVRASKKKKLTSVSERKFKVLTWYLLCNSTLLVSSFSIHMRH